MSAISELKRLEPFLGKEIFLSDWISVTQAQINQFADSTKDNQLIHVDMDKSSRGPFGKTIAHGFLILSLLPFFSYQIPLKPEGVSMTINYGLDRVRFLNPVVSGAMIRDRVTLTSLEEKQGNRLLLSQTHTIEIQGQEKPSCIAQTLTMFFF